MDRTPQTKFFELLRRRCSPHNIEVVVDLNYANQGIIHFQRPGSFETALSIPFAFQTGYATFGWHGNQTTPKVFRGHPNPSFIRPDTHELDTTIDELVAYLKENA